MTGVLAVIPCRRGSKGLPGKNRATIAGLPLWLRAAKACRQARYIDDVVISTDDQVIYDEAKELGYKVHARSSLTASDTASSESVLIEACDDLNLEPDILVLVQCTSPFTTSLELDQAVKTMTDDFRIDSLFSARPFYGFVWGSDDRSSYGGYLPIDHPKELRQRRQDRPVRVIETGAYYMVRYKEFRRAKTRFFGDTFPFITGGPHIDIDSHDDLVLARLIPQPWAFRHTPKVVVLDFDGVFTDNKVTLHDNHDSLSCDRSDGWGIQQLLNKKFPVACMTKSRSPLVNRRLDYFKGIERMTGVDNKNLALKRYAEFLGYRREDIAYLGNDTNDLRSVIWAGTGIAPSDAHPKVKASADVVLSSVGGKGAIREVCDRVLSLLT